MASRNGERAALLAGPAAVPGCRARRPAGSRRPRRFRVRLAALALWTLLSATAPGQAGWAQALGSYNADIKETTISGISAGAFMAVQFATAWSSVVKGVGIVAGGPDYCAQGTAIDGLLFNVPSALRATGACMAGPPPSLEPIFETVDGWARSGAIDDTANLRRQKIYIFDGYNDAVVRRSVTDATERFYRHYLTARNTGNIFYQTAVGAGHSQVTYGYGLPCASNQDYFIDDCRYDQAGIILQHLYGALAPRNAGPLGGRLEPFSQRDFTAPESPASYSMAETGYVYVPAACAKQEPCRVHIALHGCKQYAGLIGDRYTRHAGYNEWADSNHIIVLYPQTVAGNPATDPFTPMNPNGCWDWWGYTNFNYAVKAGRQIAAIKAMLDRLTEGATPSAPAPPPTPDAPAQPIVNDASDSTIDLAWPKVEGATAYRVYRATPAARSFAPVGTVAGPSFGDSGLAAATRYIYRVAAVIGGAEGPASAPVAAATRAVPPRCAHPGACALPP